MEIIKKQTDLPYYKILLLFEYVADMYNTTQVHLIPEILLILSIKNFWTE